MSGTGNGIVYVQTKGTEDMPSQYAVISLARAARSMGVDVAMFYMLRGAEVPKKAVVEKIGPPTEEMPALKELLKKAIEEGVEIYVCPHSGKLCGINPGGYFDGIKTAGAATLNDLAVGYGTVITF